MVAEAAEADMNEERRIVYVIVTDSCSDCNVRGIRAQSSPPTEKDVEEVWETAGGGTCGNKWVYELEVDGEALRIPIRQY